MGQVGRLAAMSFRLGRQNEVCLRPAASVRQIEVSNIHDVPRGTRVCLRTIDVTAEALDLSRSLPPASDDFFGAALRTYASDFCPKYVLGRSASVCIVFFIIFHV